VLVDSRGLALGLLVTGGRAVAHPQPGLGPLRGPHPPSSLEIQATAGLRVSRSLPLRSMDAATAYSAVAVQVSGSHPYNMLRLEAFAGSAAPATPYRLWARGHTAQREVGCVHFVPDAKTARCRCRSRRKTHQPGPAASPVRPEALECTRSGPHPGPNFSVQHHSDQRSLHRFSQPQLLREPPRLHSAISTPTRY